MRDYAIRPEIPSAAMADYPGALRTIRDAHRAHGEIQGFSEEEKIAGYGRLEGIVAALGRVLDEIDAAAPAMAAARRKAQWRERISIGGFVVAVLGLAVALASLLR